ncbi:hypothetical protein pb186bvf_010642 [Paramecium bursaria]
MPNINQLEAVLKSSELSFYYDLRNNIQDRYLDLLINQEEIKYRLIVRYDHKYFFLVDYLFYFFELGIYSSFMYISFVKWLDLSDNEKFINQSSIPVGFIYVIITLIFYVFQGISYNDQSQKQKELDLLLKDFENMDNFKIENQQGLQDFVQYQNEPFKYPLFLSFMQVASILSLQLFTTGLSQAFFQIVALSNISEFRNLAQRKIATYWLLRILKKNLNTRNNLSSYCGLYDLKSNNYLNKQVQQKILNIIDDIIHNDGLNIIAYQQILNSNFYLQIVFVILNYNILHFFAFKLMVTNKIEKCYKLYRQYTNSQFYINFSIYYYLLILRLFSIGKNSITIIIATEKYIGYINQCSYNKISLIKFISRLITEREIIIILLVPAQFVILFVSQNFDQILNLFDINYLANIDVAAINNIYHSYVTRHNLIQFIDKFGFPEHLKYKTFDQFYIQYLGLQINIEQIQNNQLTNQETASLIYQELKDLQNKLKFEDGFQLSFKNKVLSFVVRITIIILEIILLIFISRMTKYPLIFFSQYFSQAISNIVSIEFLFYLDEHCLSKLFRYWYSLEKLNKQQNINHICLYREIWDIKESLTFFYKPFQIKEIIQIDTLRTDKFINDLICQYDEQIIDQILSIEKQNLMQVRFERSEVSVYANQKYPIFFWRERLYPISFYIKLIS